LALALEVAASAGEDLLSEKAFEVAVVLKFWVNTGVEALKL